mgnify:FL=1
MSSTLKGYVNSELLVTPGEFEQQLRGSVPPLVIDLRSAEKFAQGHVPGAVHLDLFGVSLIDTQPAPLEAFLWMVGHLLTTRGVSQDRSTVVYDEQSGIRAARAFWFLELFGHSCSRLLDGGFCAWVRQGFVTTIQTATPDKAEWDIARVSDRVATCNDVASRVGRDGVVLLDTRSDAEYYGTNVRAKRGGAIPGAVHIEWTRNLDGSGAFKAASELRSMYEENSVTPDKEVISYCQGGYRAAHSYLALRLLGYPRIRNYVGSWKEWGDREDLPVERPSL